MAEAPQLPEEARDEIRIVWVDPRWRDYPFVREKCFLAARGAGAPGKGHGLSRLVGYAELSPRAKTQWSGGRCRRVWLLHEGDFEQMPRGKPVGYADEAGLICSCPIEGVLPESVAPGKRSVAAIDELRARPRPIPSPGPVSTKYEHVVGVQRTAMADPPKTPEKPSRSYPFSYLLEGQPFQMRAARMDAAIRAAGRAQVECHSAERERARGGRGPSAEEVSNARISAAAMVYERWWPSELARLLAEADFGPEDTEAAEKHSKMQADWLARSIPRVR